ncbi:MAG TPA: hypothetical protein VMF53_17630 [Alphaproteobacteria bacterium]|nr:hypothetical protein [Alphaproteobacteria bacterium]
MALLVQLVLIAVVLIVPLWRIFRRAGLNPAFSLLVLIPLLGSLAVLAILAFAPWPATVRGGRPS